MDEKMQELVEKTLRERFEIANSALLLKSNEYAEMTQRLVALSEKIYNTPDMSEVQKSEIESYLAIVAKMDGVFQKHLYLQGAKDCVAVLKELGVVK